MQREHDPAVITAVTAALEASVNRALALAPVASRELAEMADTVLAIECTAPVITVYITITLNGYAAGQ